MNNATHVHLQGQFSLLSECQYIERRSLGNKTCVLPHIYQWVEFYAVSSHGNVTITAGLLFSHSALNTETASFFKIMENQVHHNNVTTKNVSTWCDHFWTHTKSQTDDNSTIVYELEQMSVYQSSCCHSVLLNGFAHNIYCLTLGILRTHTGQQTCSLQFLISSYLLYPALN